MKAKHNDHTQSMHLLQRGGNTKTQTFMDYIVCFSFYLHYLKPTILLISD